MPFTYAPESYNDSAASKIIPYIIEIINPKSILDVGCGNGTWLSVCEKYNISDFQGIDNSALGSSEIYIHKNKIINRDLTSLFNLDRTFDVVLCLEVAEHLPESAANTLIDSLVLHSKNIIFSAAIPMQGGQDHINEQPTEFWVNLFNQKGYTAYDPFRLKFWADSSINWWYRQNMILYSTVEYTLPKFNYSFIHPECYYSTMQYLQSENSMALSQNKRISQSIINIYSALKKRLFKNL